MRELIIAAILAWIFMLSMIVLGDKARSHEAVPTAMSPLGWTYGADCCSVMDCFQEQSSNIRERKDGYEIISTNELIVYSDKRIRISKDEFFHRCTALGNPTMKRSICLYVPNKGF